MSTRRQQLQQLREAQQPPQHHRKSSPHASQSQSQSSLQQPPQSQQREKLSERAARSAVRPDLAMLDARVPSHDDPTLGAHSKKWQVDVARIVHTQVAHFVASGQYGFENVAEFVRFAVVFTMDYLERLDPPSYPSNTQILKAIASEVGQSETRLNYLQWIEASSVQTFELLGKGMDGEAEKLVVRVLEHIRALPKSDSWRQLYETTFKQRFGHILKRGKIADLTSFGDAAENDEDEEE